MKHAGTRIRDRRNQIGMSAADLAARISLSRATVHRYENGDIENIKMPVLAAIARELDVSVAWLIGKSDVADVEPVDSSAYSNLEEIVRAVSEHVTTAATIKCCGKAMSDMDRRSVLFMLDSMLKMMTVRYR